MPPERSSADLESAKPRSRISHWKMIIDQGVTTPAIETWHYAGSGTEEDPYSVTWIDNDPRNPMNFPNWYKWMITMMMAFAVLAVALCSSAFSGGVAELIVAFHISPIVATLGLSLFVLGFAIGPLFWAPLSELFGRQILFFLTFGCFVFFNAGVAGSQNIWTVIILRFFSGAFGSSPLTNAGGVIADCFPARARGLAMSIFAAAPFLGPALGPIIGNFLGESAGWRWVMGFMAAFSGVGWFLGSFFVPETYAPYLLRRRAAHLSKTTGKVYKSKMDIDRGSVAIGEALKTAMTRPWILLFREPIVIILSLYMAIVYGTLYMLFAAFPIVYMQSRHWSGGIGGLAFLGILIGMFLAVTYYIVVDNPRYQKVADQYQGDAPPEARLPASLIGAVLLPVGLFWFAWTNSPSIHWAVSMAAGIPIGAGMVFIFLSIMNYLIDSYTIFAASVLAANSVLRSCFGAAFPLFTSDMYKGLGIHWASSVPAFLALALAPFPFLFYKYGRGLRLKCKYAAESAAFMERMNAPGDEQEEGDSDAEDPEKAAQEEHDSVGQDGENAQRRSEPRPRPPRFERIRTGTSSRSRRAEWDDNPYVIDRVNTRESFGSGMSRARSFGSNKAGKV